MIGMYSRRVDKYMRVVLPKRLFPANVQGNNIGQQTVYLAIIGRNVGDTFLHEPALSLFLSEKKLNDHLVEYREQIMISVDDEFPNHVQCVDKCIVDKRGRIKLPKWLAKKAAIDGKNDVIFVGCGEWSELWDSVNWTQSDQEVSCEELNETIKAFRQELLDLGL